MVSTLYISTEIHKNTSISLYVHKLYKNTLKNGVPWNLYDIFITYKIQSLILQ